LLYRQNTAIVGFFSPISSAIHEAQADSPPVSKFVTPQIDSRVSRVKQPVSHSMKMNHRRRERARNPNSPITIRSIDRNSFFRERIENRLGRVAVGILAPD
jgi:hypothetical protein